MCIRQSRLRLHTLLSVALLFILPATALAERLSANELLDRIEAAREEPSQVHFTVRTSVLTEYTEQPQERERFDMVLDFFADGELLGAQGTSTNWKGAGDPEPRSAFFQRIWNGAQDLTFQESRTGIGQGLWTGSTSTDADNPRRLRAFYTGSELTGTFQGDQRPFYDIVRHAQDLKVKTDKKTFKGTPTYRIAATTERGHYQIWVDASLDYHFRKAIVHRGPNDLIWGDEKLSELRWLTKESMNYVITNDSFEEIDGRLLPTHGSVTVNSVFHGRGPGGSRSSTSTWDIRLEHASFAPDFEELGAFAVRAPDGTPVVAFDEDGRGGPRAVWTGDELVFDQALAKEAQSAQMAIMKARGAATKLPDIYDEDADGRELLAAALAEAKTDDKHVLIIWGANWCQWCRGLEEFVDRNPEIISVLESSYVELHMDVGRHDKNLDLGQEYGLDLAELPIPHATVLDASGAKVAHSVSAALVVPGAGGRFVYSSEAIVRFLQKNAGE